MLVDLSHSAAVSSTSDTSIGACCKFLLCSSLTARCAIAASSGSPDSSRPSTRVCTCIACCSGESNMVSGTTYELSIRRATTTLLAAAFSFDRLPFRFGEGRWLELSPPIEELTDTGSGGGTTPSGEPADSRLHAGHRYGAPASGANECQRDGRARHHALATAPVDMGLAHARGVRQCAARSARRTAAMAGWVRAWP